MKNFVYLNTQSAYSILESGMSVDDYVLALSKLGVSHAGLTDRQYLFGQPTFAKQAKSKSITPLLGVRLTYKDIELIVYPKNEEGYRHLILLLRHHEKMTMDDALLKKYSEHLIVIISANQHAIVSLGQDDQKKMRDLFKHFALLFNTLYIGIEQYEQKNEYNELIREFAKQYDYQLVAIPHVLYVKASDAINLHLADAIKHDSMLGDLQEKSGPYHLYSFEELAHFYQEQELLNTHLIAKSINFTLAQKRGLLLRYPLDKGQTSRGYIRHLCEQALQVYKPNNLTYQKRLDFELKVIDDMGYNDYFLLVYDYVKFAKKSAILVGPGRGSAAGSLVAFLLDITTIDPLKYDLLFERFLNPSRQTMPDIDIDFMDGRRDEIVTYLKTRFGEDRIANIVTFQTNAARQSIRDIGRLYQIDIKHINLLTKSLGTTSYNLRDSYRHIKSFKQLVDSDPFYLNIVTLAAKIEGFPRQTGMHAAGLILNDQPLVDSLPIFDNNGVNMTQYEMGFLEEQGFLKMDILGLTNLTTIDTCLKLIKQYQHITLDYEKIPFDDPLVYQLISSEKTMGIFQLESAGMLRAIRQIQPSEFSDVVAVLALFRPGPMENIPLYAQRKSSHEDITYLNEGFKRILAPTYGIIVYQEQIMQIVTHMAGFSYAEADMFRRAISKKDEQQLNRLEDDFLQGALKQGYKESDARHVFKDIQKFADYGFNKSHSVAYAKLACQMAYLKVYYPLEFYAAILDRSTNNDVKFPHIVSEMKSRGLSLALPSINHSQMTFFPAAKSLRLPLSVIKGLSSEKARRFIEEREAHGPFSSLENFLTRANYIDVSKNDLRLLVEGGALDEFPHSRMSMLAQVEQLEFYKNYSLDPAANFLSPIVIEKIADDPRQKIIREIELIGLAISDNPLRYVSEDASRLKLTSIANMNQAQPRIYGYIKTLKTIKTRSGDQMAFVTLSDYETDIDITLFPTTYAQYFSVLTPQRIIGVIGDYQLRDGRPQIIAKHIQELEEHL